MRITECDNPITANLDQASPREMIAAIADAERQIFGSSQWGAGLMQHRARNQLSALSRTIDATLSAGGKIVIAGAGTSGRLARSAQAIHEHRNGQGQIIGLLAGGIDAYFRAKEGVEDSPEAGAHDLDDVLDGHEPLVYLGITCGLSAAYVAGGVAHAMRRPDSHVAVLGFNRLDMASERILPGLNVSFLSLLEELRRLPNGYVINPILGPEPITGSTRMKGGSATKIVLDLLLSGEDPESWLSLTQEFQGLVYEHSAHVLSPLEQATRALREGGRITYLADARVGLTAMLDASECPPTFGSQPHQISCCVPDDFVTLLPGFAMQGHQLVDLLTSGPTPHLIVPLGEGGQLLAASLDKQWVVPLVLPEVIRDFISQLSTNWQGPFTDLAWKWLLNLLSTCAFVGYGKVYGQRMIDLRISNLKLWDRACRIISDIGNVPEAKAEAVLKEVIPGGDDQQDTAHWVALAVKCERVVPTAILMCRNSMTVEEARAHLQSQPKLTDALRLD